MNRFYLSLTVAWILAFIAAIAAALPPRVDDRMNLPIEGYF